MTLTHSCLWVSLSGFNLQRAARYSGAVHFGIEYFSACFSGIMSELVPRFLPFTCSHMIGIQTLFEMVNEHFQFQFGFVATFGLLISWWINIALQTTAVLPPRLCRIMLVLEKQSWSWLLLPLKSVTAPLKNKTKPQSPAFLSAAAQIELESAFYRSLVICHVARLQTLIKQLHSRLHRRCRAADAGTLLLGHSSPWMNHVNWIPFDGPLPGFLFTTGALVTTRELCCILIKHETDVWQGFSRLRLICAPVRCCTLEDKQAKKKKNQHK